MRSSARCARLRKVSFALTLALAMVRGAAFAGGVQAVGHPAHSFVLERPSGGETTLAAFRGRPALLNVYAAWCGSCRVEEARLIAAYGRYGDRVAFLGIDEQEGTATATSFARQMGVPYPIALDAGQFAATYGATTIPETIFIDAHGIVRAIAHGMISSARLERELARIAPPEDKQ
jgi:cytochrome c biogenesis protein CcmG/thiol:disulfide interchange protein DsbE